MSTEKEYCGECEKETEATNTIAVYGAKFHYCDACYEYNFCECGNRLEEEEGSCPGDGFCARCR
jgi:hypothetical protein